MGSRWWGLGALYVTHGDSSETGAGLKGHACHSLGSLTCSRARSAVLGWRPYSIFWAVTSALGQGLQTDGQAEQVLAGSCIIFSPLSRELMGAACLCWPLLGLDEPSISLVLVDSSGEWGHLLGFPVVLSMESQLKAGPLLQVLNISPVAHHAQSWLTRSSKVRPSLWNDKWPTKFC